MHSMKSLLLTLLLCLSIPSLPSCRGTAVQGALSTNDLDHAPRTPLIAAAAGVGSREALRAVSQLETQVALDRKAVELAEGRVMQARTLFGQGRVSGLDRQAAELGLLQVQVTLQHHERELEDARLGPATASAREASRVASHLRAQIAVDRKMVELGEHRLTQARSLYGGGRASVCDVSAAELELLNLQATLRRHERDLADAQLHNAAGEASSRS